MSIRNLLMSAGGIPQSAGSLYWRLSITAALDTASQQRIAEIDFSDTAPLYNRVAIQNVTSNIAPYSSIYNVYDNNMTSYTLWTYIPTVANPLNIDLRYGTPRNMKQMRIGITNQNGFAPLAFNVYKSDNGIDWTLVKAFTNQLGWSSSELRLLQLT